MISSFAQVEDGKPKRFIHCYADVTEQRAIEELIRRMGRLMSIGQLAVGVAHEINNTLNAIMGLAELLAERVEDARHKEMLFQINAMVRRIAGITNGLLAFARPKPDDLHPINMNELVKGIIGARASTLHGSNIKFVLRLCEPLPTVMGDESQLKQVFLSLILNAEDSMSKRGGMTLTITTQVKGRHIVVHVDGTGVGIDEEFLPQQFAHHQPSQH